MATRLCRGAWILALCSSACQAPKAPEYRVHHTLLDGTRQPPQRVLVLNPEALVFEVTAGRRVEELPARSRELATALGAEISAELAARGITAVAEPELTADEAALRRELFERFAISAASTVPVQLGVADAAALAIWWPEIERFDLWIGKELDFLRERTGCDVALMNFHLTVDPTSGRAATALFSAILTGSIPQEEHTRSYLGLVDLASGDILWLDAVSTQRASSDGEAAKATVATLLARYPGIDEYARVLTATRAQLEEAR